ncbi:MAG TPA: phosphotransferase [Thermomicrobiales bacterium]|nr:phosphotransferase [Thermomicrobiales bacterium]
MQPFAFLTEQGRARRMRPLAFAALEHYGFDVRRLRLVNNETNCTFRVDTEDGQTFALRISVPDIRTLAETRAEIAWLGALARESDIPVARPIPTRTGEFIVEAGARGVPEPRRCVLFEWVRGRTVGERPTRPQLREFGRLIARLHSFGASYRPPTPEAVRRMDQFFPLGGPDVLLNEDTRALLSPQGYDRLREMRAAVERELAWLYGRDEPPSILHGDFHWWNVMAYRDTLRPIDFEDLCWGYPIQDLAISAYYTAPGEHEEVFRAEVRRGYEEIAPWPELYPSQLDLHRVHRALDLFNFVLGSTYRHDQQLMEHFLDRIQGHHWQVYETWKSKFDERFYA